MSLIFFLLISWNDEVSQSNLLLVPAAAVRIFVASYGLTEEFYHFSKLLQDIYCKCLLLLKLLPLIEILCMPMFHFNYLPSSLC